MEIDELNHQGEWSAVEVQSKPDVPSAGVFQLQQVSLMSDEGIPLIAHNNK